MVCGDYDTPCRYFNFMMHFSVTAEIGFKLEVYKKILKKEIMIDLRFFSSSSLKVK